MVMWDFRLLECLFPCFVCFLVDSHSGLQVSVFSLGDNLDAVEFRMIDIEFNLRFFWCLSTHCWLKIYKQTFIHIYWTFESNDTNNIFFNKYKLFKDIYAKKYSTMNKLIFWHNIESNWLFQNYWWALL